MAVTDPGTPLARLASEREFAATVISPPDVGGRYSALAPFGLVPAALSGIDPSALLDRAGDLAARARLHPAEATVDLGARWGLLAAAGRDKLTFLISDGLAPFGWWLEQLDAESLGKDGTGIVPVVGEGLRSPADYGQDRQFVAYRLEQEPDPVPAGLADGHPVVEVVLEDRYELAAEMLRAELATAAAGEILARDAMRSGVNLAELPTVRAGHDDLDAAIDKLVDPAPVGSYVAIQAYLEPSPTTDVALGKLREALGVRTGFATTLGYGPRFLHSTGQLHKGGPDTGLFLQIVDDPQVDLVVPETEFTFGQIIAAQAAGDYRALVERGRNILRIDVGADPEGGLAAVVDAAS